jgi:glycosyltransferase involved in cell wall biosynthesis
MRCGEQTVPANNRGKKLRVLLLAEAANPDWASVPLIGWSLSQALAKLADVHLVTQVRNKEAILRRGLLEGTEFTVIDNEGIASPLDSISALIRGGKGKGWTTVAAFASFAYYSFELQVWKKFRKRLMAGEFDVVHRITPVSPTSQSLLAAKLARLQIPFVVGPLNGGVPWPKGFRHRQYAENEFLSHVRKLYRLMPAYRSMRRNSAAIISGSRFTQSEMPDWVKEKSIYIPENGVDINRFSNPRDPGVSLPLQAVFIGRLVPYKGADILIAAAAPFLSAGTLKLHILGDGPQRESLHQKVRELGVQDSVVFHGWIPHDEIQDKLRTFDFLALPSIREFGGGVVVEAMALGVTPIVADYGGPAELVTDITGIRIPFTDETSLVEGFRSTIAEIIRSPDLLNKLGAAARADIQDKLTWDAKARQIVRIYEAVTARVPDLRFLSLQIQASERPSQNTPVI